MLAIGSKDDRIQSFLAAAQQARIPLGTAGAMTGQPALGARPSGEQYALEMATIGRNGTGREASVLGRPGPSWSPCAEDQELYPSPALPFAMRKGGRRARRSYPQPSWCPAPLVRGRGDSRGDWKHIAGPAIFRLRLLQTENRGPPFSSRSDEKGGAGL